MIYTMIALMALSFVLIAVNYKNKHTWLFTLLTIGLDLSLFSFIFHITRTLNYKYPRIPLFNLDYKIYLYISELKIGYYDLIYLLNIGIIMVVLSLFLIIDEFTGYKYHNKSKRKRIFKYVLFLSFLVFYVWFYSPPTSFKFYTAVIRDYSSNVNEIFVIIKIIDLINYIVVLYFLFRPILITFHEYIRTTIIIRKQQTLTLAISLLVLNMMFVLVIISGPFRKIYFLSDNPSETFLWHTSRMPMPFIFYKIAPFALLISVTVLTFVIIRNRVVNLSDRYKKYFISKKLRELYRNIRGVLHSYKNTLFRIKILIDQLETEQDVEKKNSLLTRLKEVTDLSLNNMSRTLDSLKEIRINPQVSNIVDSMELALKRIPFNDAITVLKNYQNHEIYCYMDDYHLAEVFFNILENAVDELSNITKTDKTIRIEVKQEHEWNIINITDNASGIEKKKIKKIFDPFYSTKNGGRNLGIGLSYALRIIKMHFGIVNVESTVGSHTTFQIILPRYTMVGNHG